MEYGIVYLLTNPVMPGLVKIGMQYTNTKFFCIERTLDTTKKFNLKNKMQDKFFAF